MEERHVGRDKIQLLNQALNAASSSLNLAKQLLSEVEHRSGNPEMPGLVGKYDGMFMVTEAGKKYPVPDNYSAKTKLVYGDKLKMVEGPEGRRFKLLEEMEREEQEAQLAVKDGHFEALGKDGSYKLIQGAVRYWSGEEGDKIKIILPKGQRNVPFAGLVEIIGREPGAGVPEQPATPKLAPKPVVSPPVAKREEPKPVAKAPVEKEAPKEKKEEKPVKKETEKPDAKRVPAKEAPRKSAPTEAAAAKPAKPLDKEDLR
jgi:hypothetical protein